MARRRVAVLVSGGGTNLQALLDATRNPAASARVVLVLSNRPGAGGLTRAAAAGVPHQTIDHRSFASRPAFEAALQESLEASAVELVCLAGFMRVLTEGFVERWRGRMINIHPSLLPAFPGLRTHARVLEAGVRITGCTVHAVRAAVDAGPVLVQGVVPVLEGDSEAGLAARVLAMEHRCYPRALELLASGRLRLDGDQVMAADHATDRLRLLLDPGLAGESLPPQA